MFDHLVAGMYFYPSRMTQEQYETFTKGTSERQGWLDSYSVGSYDNDEVLFIACDGRVGGCNHVELLPDVYGADGLLVSVDFVFNSKETPTPKEGIVKEVTYKVGNKSFVTEKDALYYLSQENLINTLKESGILLNNRKTSVNKFLKFLEDNKEVISEYYNQ